MLECTWKHETAEKKDGFFLARIIYRIFSPLKTTETEKKMELMCKTQMK